MLTPPMLRLSTRKLRFLKAKPCHVGIHWIAPGEYSQMVQVVRMVQVPGFQSFFRLFSLFFIGQINQQQHKC